MADIRANCPDCGQVGIRPEDISLELAGDGVRGQYAFTCPDCSADVIKPADGRIVGLLLAAGVVTTDTNAAAEETFPQLPDEDRSPRPEASAFTFDDLIDLHFLLEDDAWLREEIYASESKPR
jgi:hypothetical protein